MIKRTVTNNQAEATFESVTINVPENGAEYAKTYHQDDKDKALDILYAVLMQKSNFDVMFRRTDGSQAAADKIMREGATSDSARQSSVANLASDVKAGIISAEEALAAILAREADKKAKAKAKKTKKS